VIEECASNAVSPEEKSNLSKVGKCRPINKSSNAAIMKRRIFDQERIEAVVEICLGAASPSEMDLFPLDVENRQYCATVRKKL
jgi:hypothetical protein